MRIRRIRALAGPSVRDGGAHVLNADDEELSRLLEIPRVRDGEKRVVYFSTRDDHPPVSRHPARRPPAPRVMAGPNGPSPALTVFTT